MNDMNAKYDNLIENITRFANAQPDIEVIWIFGSRARNIKPADQWSDLDILMLTTAPQKYLDHSEWINELGDARITFTAATAAGDATERRVLFKEGMDLDVTIYSISKFKQLAFIVNILTNFKFAWKYLPENEAGSIKEFIKVHERGLKAIVDKKGFASNLNKLLDRQEKQVKKQPTELEFSTTVLDFYYHAVWIVKKLKRNEIWVANDCNNGHLKKLLVKILEWHTIITNNSDVWHDGRFVQEWANPQYFKSAIKTFSAYEKEELLNSLQVSVELINSISSEITQRMQWKSLQEEFKFTKEIISEINDEKE
jgi:aminoglycoside 6-adenylyltransferase